MVKRKQKNKIQESNLSVQEKHIILYNDDCTDFIFVVKSLIEVCGHTNEQAEQCALIAHLNGRCEIKRGSIELLLNYCEKLSQRNLSVSIE